MMAAPDSILAQNQTDVNKTLVELKFIDGNVPLCSPTRSQSTEELSTESFNDIPLIEQLKNNNRLLKTKRHEISLDQFDTEGWNSNEGSYVSNGDYSKFNSDDDEGKLIIVDKVDKVDKVEKADKLNKFKIEKTKKNILKSKDNKSKKSKLSNKLGSTKVNGSKKSKITTSKAETADAVASILSINEEKKIDDELHSLAVVASEVVIADINDEELLLSCPEPSVPLNCLIPSTEKNTTPTDQTTNTDTTTTTTTTTTTNIVARTITIPTSLIKTTKKRSLDVAPMPQSKRQKTMLINLKNKVDELNVSLSNVESELEKSIFTIEINYLEKQIKMINKNDDSIEKQLMYAKSELSEFDKLQPKSHPVLKRNNLKQRINRLNKKINGENAAKKGENTDKISTLTNETEMAKKQTNKQTTDDIPSTSYKHTDTFKIPRVPKLKKKNKVQNNIKVTQFAKNNIFKSINEQLIDPSQILKPFHYIALSSILTITKFNKLEKGQYARVVNVQNFLNIYSLSRPEICNEKVHFQNLWEHDDLELYSFEKKVVNTDILLILKNMQYNKTMPNVIFRETRQNKSDTEYKRLNFFLQLACKCYIIQHLRAMITSVANVHTFHTTPYMRMRMHQRDMHIAYFLPHDSVLEKYYEINESGKLKLQEKFVDVALSIPLFQRRDVNYYLFRAIFPTLPSIEKILDTLKHDVDRSTTFLAKKEELKKCNQAKRVLLLNLKSTHETTTDSPKIKPKENDEYRKLTSQIDLLKRELNNFKGLSKLLQIIYVTLNFSEMTKVVNFLRFQFFYILSARPTTTLVDLISDIFEKPGTDGPSKFIDTILTELVSLMPQSNNQLPFSTYSELSSRNIY